MTKVSSQRARQVQMVVDEPRHVDYPLEKMALFDQWGNQINLAVITGQIPPGGIRGQIMAKLTDDDFDVGWQNPPRSTSNGGGGGGGGGGGAAWAGDWDLNTSYPVNSIIRYNDSTYIVIEPIVVQNLPLYQGVLVTDWWTDYSVNFWVSISNSSPTALLETRGEVTPFQIVGINVTSPGTLDIMSRKSNNTVNDMYALLYQLVDGAWSLVNYNDDGAANGHPRIYLETASAGTYLYVYTKYGVNSANELGVLSAGPENTAEWSGGGASSVFPEDNVILLGSPPPVVEALIWRGEWSESSYYAVNALVSDGGFIWRAMELIEESTVAPSAPPESGGNDPITPPSVVGTDPVPPIYSNGTGYDVSITAYYFDVTGNGDLGFYSSNTGVTTFTIYNEAGDEMGTGPTPLVQTMTIGRYFLVIGSPGTSFTIVSWGGHIWDPPPPPPPPVWEKLWAALPE